MPRFSVIIAAHDRPSLLARAIRSVKVQGFADAAVIVVSDTGSACIAAVARAHLSRSDRFIQRTGTPGPAASRNAGLEASSAPFVMFLDDDDEHSATFLQAADAAAQAGCGSVLFSDFSVVQDPEDRCAEPDGHKAPVQLGGRDPLEVHVRNFIPNSALVFPADAVRHRMFDDTLVLNEDWDFLLAVMQGAKLRHFPSAGPVIHKTDRSKGDRRGAVNDHLLPENIRAIYRKFPAPTPALRAARQRFFAEAGLFLAPGEA